MKRRIKRAIAAATASPMPVGIRSADAWNNHGRPVLAVALGILAGVTAAPRVEAQQVAPRLTPGAAVAAYCAAWNTVDKAERDRLLEQSWASDGVYSDPEPTYVQGRAALGNTIADFQRGHPGARFRCSSPQEHHGFMRVTWILLGPDGVERWRGTDFSDLAPDGRIRRVVGFFGAPPVVKP